MRATVGSGVGVRAGVRVEIEGGGGGSGVRASWSGTPVEAAGGKKTDVLSVSPHTVRLVGGGHALFEERCVA